MIGVLNIGFFAKTSIITLFNRGICRTQTKGALRKWLDARVRPGTDIKVYGDKAYVIALAESDNQCERLITVLQIPHEIMRNKKRMIVAA